MGTTTFAETINFLGYVLTIKETLLIVCWLIGALLLGVVVTIWSFRRQLRLFCNMSKPVLFLNLTSPEKPLDTELKLFKNGGVYGEINTTNDPRELVSQAPHSLVVICVDDTANPEVFKEAFKHLMSKNQPVVLYTMGSRGTQILSQESQLLSQHPTHSIATTPIRLVSDLLSIVVLK